MNVTILFYIMGESTEVVDVYENKDEAIKEAKLLNKTIPENEKLWRGYLASEEFEVK